MSPSPDVSNSYRELPLDIAHMSERERAMRAQVLWQRIEHAEGLLASIVDALENLIGPRPPK